MTYPNGNPGRDERASLGALVSSLSQNVSTLVRDEIALAKAEVSESAKRGATGGGLLAATAMLVMMVWLLLTWAAVYGLTDGPGLPLWASFLIVAAVYLVIAVILAFVAKRHLEQAKGPQQAQKAAEETKQILSGLKPATSSPSGPGSAAPGLSAPPAPAPVPAPSSPAPTTVGDTSTGP